MQDMRIEIYLPIAHPRAATAVVNELCSGSGGATITRGIGHWEDSGGVRVTEEVDIATCFVCDDADNRMWVEAIARRFKEDANQDCVLYVLNGNETFFIED